MSGLFGTSPICPLQNHMQVIHTYVQSLSPLFVGLIEQDIDKISSSATIIVKAEHAADDLKKELRHHLPKGLFMLVNRHC